MERPKCKTLAELVMAYRSGELTRETAVLMLDNDSVSVTWHAEDDPDWELAEDVFEMHPEDLLRQALDLLQLPWEHV